MEQTTLQQRIEERASKRLLTDLYLAAQKEKEIKNLIANGDNDYELKLAVVERNRGRIDSVYEVYNDFSKKIFAKLLPNYIRKVTDEILQKIDEIDYIVNNKEEDY